MDPRPSRRGHRIAVCLQGAFSAKGPNQFGAMAGVGHEPSLRLDNCEGSTAGGQGDSPDVGNWHSSDRSIAIGRVGSLGFSGLVDYRHEPTRLTHQRHSAEHSDRPNRYRSALEEGATVTRCRLPRAFIALRERESIRARNKIRGARPDHPAGASSALPWRACWRSARCL